MHIDFSINNPTCSDNNGSIIIDAIVFNNQEFSIYSSNYTIEWSNNIPIYNIGSNNLVVKNLDAGNYAFRIYGNGRYSEWKDIILTKSEPLQILNIDQSYDDMNLRTINIQFSGGVAPYVVSYNKYHISTDINQASIPVTEDSSGIITITDANNCLIKSDNIIHINFPIVNFNLIEQKAPLIYDDTLESIKFSVFYHNITDYTIKIISSDNQELIIDSTYKYLQDHNIDYYELKSLLYPGKHTIEIYDNHNHLVYYKNIQLLNRNPLKANIDIVNDAAIGSSFICPVMPILDSILIPYDLVKNDEDIWHFISNIYTNLIIEIYINNVKYVQKIINYSHIADKKNKDSVEWLKLSDNNSEWFFCIQVSNGLNLNNNPTHLTDTITLKVQDKFYLIQQGLSNTLSQNISLIRKNLIISSSNKVSLQTCRNIALVSDTTTNCEILNNKNLYNEYSVGSVSSIGLKDYNMSILKILNNYSNNLSCYSLDNIINTGSISVNVPNYSQDKYTITYKYVGATNQLENLYCNNKILNANRASFLRSGTYILDILDQDGNKIKYINNQDYDAHYQAASEQAKASNIPFNYGQILINILNSTSDEQDIPGIEQTIVVKPLNIIPKFSIQRTNIIEVSSENLTNSLEIIIQPANTPCIIKGPNNFHATLSTQTKFIKLPIGVYTVCGEENFLYKNYLSQNSKDIVIGPNSKEHITVLFNSYFNKCIIGK